MRIMIFLLMGNCFILIACHKKTLPVITDRSGEYSKPVIDTAMVVPDITRGKQLFSTRCIRCHALPEPGLYTSQHWDDILAIMIPRARLTREQSIHISAYLKDSAVK